MDTIIGKQTIQRATGFFHRQNRVGEVWFFGIIGNGLNLRALLVHGNFKRRHKFTDDHFVPGRYTAMRPGPLVEHCWPLFLAMVSVRHCCSHRHGHRGGNRQRDKTFCLHEIFLIVRCSRLFTGAEAPRRRKFAAGYYAIGLSALPSTSLQNLSVKR